MTFFDAHTHVQFAAFADDYKDVIRRALDAGVGFINVGTQRDTSRQAVEIAREYEKEPVFAAVGLHPIHTEKSFHDTQELGSPSTGSGFTSRGEEFDYDYYKKLASDPKVVAIGECGLDYYHLEQSANRPLRQSYSEASEAQIEKQKNAFVQQIELAKELRKPLMIHCRSAFDDLIAVLNDSRHALSDLPGVVHFFSGTKDDAKALLDLGFSFTFGGAITFPSKARLPAVASAKAGDYDEVIKMIPVDRILSETDAPYVAPVPYRGRRNEPAYVVEVVKKIAEIKGVSTEEIAARVLENAQVIFRLT